MYIFAYFGSQVNQLTILKFFLKPERVHLNIFLEALQAFHASEGHPYGYPTSSKDAPLGDANVQAVKKWGYGLAPCLIQTELRCVLFSFEMESSSVRNLI